MTERLEYQERIVNTDYPDIFAVDFEKLEPAEIQHIQAKRFAAYVDMIDNLTPTEKTSVEKEASVRDSFGDRLNKTIQSRRILFNLTGVHQVVSALYRYNELTKTEEKEYLRRIAPILFEYKIDLP